MVLRRPCRLVGNFTDRSNVSFLSTADSGNALAVETAAQVATVVNAWELSRFDTVYLIIVDEEGNSAIYAWRDAGNNECDAGELTLMATIDATLTAADIIFS